MPSGIDVSTAAAITAPSTKVWKASPTITSDAALLVCTSHSCVSWQWRQSTSFSSRKNASTPASSVPSAVRGRQALERLRQQREQRDAEQRADGITDRPGQDLDAERVAEEQESGGRQQTAEAAEHAQADGRRVKSARGMISHPASAQAEYATNPRARAHLVARIAQLDADRVPASVLHAGCRVPR